MYHQRARWSNWCATGLALLLLVAFQARAEEKTDSAGKVAVVNGKVITQAEFDREMIPVQQRICQPGGRTQRGPTG